MEQKLGERLQMAQQSLAPSEMEEASAGDNGLETEQGWPGQC